eukprot:6079406-Amphidinium_carterae.4
MSESRCVSRSCLLHLGTGFNEKKAEHMKLALGPLGIPNMLAQSWARTWREHVQSKRLQHRVGQNWPKNISCKWPSDPTRQEAARVRRCCQATVYLDSARLY